MRVALVSGSYPPDPCGVGAFVDRLAEVLRERGVDAENLGGTSWRVRDARAIRARIDSARPDLVHLHYPTLGYGAGLAPQLLSILRPGIVTLHEVAHTHPLRQLSLAAFAVSARHVVLTTEAERRYLLRFAPWLRDRSSVIPVGSSVPVVSSRLRTSALELVHFGLIRPEKGLEDVVELARLGRRSDLDLSIRVIGQVVPKWRSYFESLRNASAELPLTWETDVPIRRVGELLAQSRIGYLPFPDGASERRTSLVALLEAGIATITTRGSDTPATLARAVAFAETPEAALDLTRQLNDEPEALERLASAGRRYARHVAWDRIASSHQSLYSKVAAAG